MNVTRCRERLSYTAMSLFVAWHCCAMIVAPAPRSDLWQLMQQLQQPYLTLFRLNNAWSFFAPEVPRGTILRYRVEDSGGTSHTVDPTAELNRLSPAYVWFTSWFDEIVHDPERFGDAAAQYFCRKHSALTPVSITLLRLRQEEFLPKDQLAGRHPLHPDFLTETTLKQVTCADR
jgi:hypothetical protein